jgi:hypothetical protein
MKFTLSDVGKLKFGLLGAAVMIAVGAGAVHMALGYDRTVVQQRNGLQRERDAIDGKLRRVRNEENEIKDKSALFKTLQDRGIIGEEQRLEWVELLGEIRDDRRLPDLQYEFEPQRPLSAAPGSSSDFSFFASTMKAQLRLLHEEDLLRFLDDLRRQARALIRIDSCNVSRLARGIDPTSGTSAQLQAECKIDWITLRAAENRTGVAK